MKMHFFATAIVSASILGAASASAAQIESGNATPAGSQAAQTVAFVAQRAPLDPAALQRAQQKFAHVMQVVKGFDAVAQQQGFGNDNWRYKIIANLMKADENSFSTVQSAADIADAINRSYAAIQQHQATAGLAKSLGTVTSDLVYVPINPCRILDTRQGAGATIGQGQTKTYNYDAANVGAGSCSVDSQIPGGAFLPAAEAVNVTLDETGLTGFAVGAYIAIFPQGGTAGSSFMNFGPSQIIANAGVISVNQSNGEFNILASRPANVIVDAFGLFIPPQETALDCLQVDTAFTPLAASASGNTDTATCPTGYTATGGACRTGSFDLRVVDFAFVGNGYGCSFKNSNSTTAASMAASAMCCRVPGR